MLRFLGLSLKSSYLFGSMLSFSLGFAEKEIDSDPVYELEPFVVKTEAGQTNELSLDSSGSEVLSEDFAVWEPTDAADLLRYFPNVNINKPSIGSDESLIAIRDQSALANGRLWVLVDGFPISNPLRAGAAGAARLNLVDPQTIDSVELEYGPFSASYGGYALGGVIHYNTLPIDQSSAEIGVRYFWHDFDLYGTDDVYEGYRANFRVSERIGNLGIGLSGSYLEEEGNPQRFVSTTNFRTFSPPIPGPPAVSVSGGFVDQDPQGEERIVYGSQGTRETTVGTVAFDTAYYFQDATLRWTSRYSDRNVQADDPESYLFDSSGNEVTSGRVNLGGRVFQISPSLSGEEEQNESEWLNGLGLSGELSNDWSYDLSLSVLEILESESETANRIETTPNAYWLNGKATFSKEDLFQSDKLGGRFGYEWIQAELEDEIFNSDGSFKERTGGETNLHAVFATLGWQMSTDWRLILGLRAEQWEASDGFAEYIVTTTGTTTTLESDRYDEREETGLSPKLTLEYTLNSRDTIRLNVARTYRFPLVQELFRQDEDVNGNLTISDPNLAPEESTNLELSWIRDWRKGRLRLTAFRNEVDNAILQQFVDPSVPLPGSPPLPFQDPSYLNIDKVETFGLEAFILQRDLFVSKLECSIGLGWMNSEIKRYEDDTSVEGNEYPGVPEWRANASLRYRWNRFFETALGARYQSYIFERIDNTDTLNTLGSVSERLIFDLSAVYRFENDLSLNVRIDNLFDEEAFTNRPERQRTFSIGAEWRY